MANLQWRFDEPTRQFGATSAKGSTGMAGAIDPAGGGVVEYQDLYYASSFGSRPRNSWPLPML